MSDYKKWLDNFSIGVKFPSVSGFEILEMLQARSHLAQYENDMNVTERAELESADVTFLAHADELYLTLSEIADFSTLRAQANPLPSHWWWHLDKLVKQKLQAMAM